MARVYGFKNGNKMSIELIQAVDLGVGAYTQIAWSPADIYEHDPSKECIVIERMRIEAEANRYAALFASVGMSQVTMAVKPNNAYSTYIWDSAGGDPLFLIKQDLFWIRVGAGPAVQQLNYQDLQWFDFRDKTAYGGVPFYPNVLIRFEIKASGAGALFTNESVDINIQYHWEKMDGPTAIAIASAIGG
jgi:hypothetical protein